MGLCSISITQQEEDSMARKYPAFMDSLVDLCNKRTLSTAFSKEGCHEDPASMYQWRRVMALWFGIDHTDIITPFFLGRHKPSTGK